MRHLPTILPGLLLLALVAGGEPETARNQAENRLMDARRRLAETETRIREEKLPLVREIAALESELARLREEARRAAGRETAATRELGEARQDAAALGAGRERTEGLLRDYAVSLESRLHPAEWPDHAPLLQRARRPGENPATTLAAGLDRLEAGVGGTRLEGEAARPDGAFVPGTFHLLGPLAYFTAPDGTAAPVPKGEDLTPRMAEVPGGTAAAIRRAFGEGGPLPVNPTLETATEPRREGIGARMGKGGVWIIPILLLAAFAATVTGAKALEILRVKRPSPARLRVLTDLLEEGRHLEAVNQAEGLPEPWRSMFGAGLRHPDLPREDLEEVFEESILAARPGLERWTPWLAVTAAVAPLLGLLGTVTGMIGTLDSLRLQGIGGGNPLPGGISEALVTTEFGLMVAVPALIAHALLSRRTHRILAEMERSALAAANAMTVARRRKGGA